MILRSITVISLLFAMLAVWYRRAEKRAFWVGYLHGGVAYALLTFYALGGITQKPVWNDEQIVSGEVARIVYRLLPESKRVAVRKDLPPRTVRLRGGVNSMTYFPQIAVASANHRYLFHSAFVVVCGWVGGLVGVWFYKTRDGRKTAVTAKSDELRVTKEALLSIANAPTVTKTDMRAKSAALRRLALFVDSQEVVRLLLSEIGYRQEDTGTASRPLENYPAAQSLAKGGSTVRSALLSVPADRYLSDKDVALRARILVAIDGSQEIAVYRLKQMLAATATPESRAHANIGRMLAYIEDPAFRQETPVDDPLS
jgi:hypothetical protein